VINHQRSGLVCLDFGRDELSAVEVVNGAVTKWFSQQLPNDVLRNGDPIEPAVLGQVVKQNLLLTGVQARVARMALPDEVAVSRLLTLPSMPQRDLARAMRYAAERHIPFPIERARWSWDVVERTAEGVSVYLVAAWLDVVERYAEVARAAGLEPQVLEPRSIAVARALNQERALLVDGGPRRLHLTLMVNGHPALVDGAAIGPGLNERREALDRLLQRAFRFQSATGGATRLAPVLFAGELETAGVQLPVAGGPVSKVLNGHLPIAPPGFRPGHFLANLGLAMRAQR
jgi:hypothetical protein